MKKNSTENSQLIKFAEDLQKVYNLERERRRELEEAYKQLKIYAEALNKTAQGLKNANKKLKEQVKLEEREKLIQRKLIQANKMTSLGTLATGIAHEINNPLNFILANTQIFLDIWKDTVKVLQRIYEDRGDFSLGGLSFNEIVETVPKMLTDSIEGAMRVNNIINGLKDYTRGGTDQEIKPIDINEVIRFSVKILYNQIIKYTSSFILKLQKNIPSAIGNPQQIEQVIINIIQNALHALPDKSCSVNVSSHLDKKSGTIKIIVADQGIGIEKEILNRITEPFFTSKQDRGGTGLGLYISYSIIQKHKGKLDIKSEPGKGTEITITLPVSRGGRGK